MQSLGLLCASCRKVLSRRPADAINNIIFKWTPSVTGVRWRKKWQADYYRQVYKRRTNLGPEPDRHRSVWTNWNYDAEIYAFSKRLGEDFNTDTLRQAFTHRSYLEEEGQKRLDLGMDTSIELGDNEQLSESGYAVASEYIRAFLRANYPHFPEEGISHVHDYLMSEEVTSFVASNIGVSDLMLCQDFPPYADTLMKTMFAVVGALVQDKGQAHAGKFVCDMLIPQLIAKDINELWPITNPMGMLVDILQEQGRPEPEPRLTRHTGDNTIMAVYFVGLYCDKELIGEAPGETVPIAEEMAARDALKRIFGTEDSRQALLLGTLTPQNVTSVQTVEPRQITEQ